MTNYIYISTYLFQGSRGNFRQNIRELTHIEFNSASLALLETLSLNNTILTVKIKLGSVICELSSKNCKQK